MKLFNPELVMGSSIRQWEYASLWVNTMLNDKEYLAFEATDFSE